MRLREDNLEVICHGLALPWVNLAWRVELTELATGISAETIEMTGISQTQGVSLTA